jgi:hypothetical protein
VGISILVGLAFALWRYKILDPGGHGGSILALPIGLTMFPLCIALFVAGLITLKEPVGRYLVLASFLIPNFFFALNRFVQNLDSF